MGRIKRKDKIKFKLTPRWIPSQFVLKGWVVIHSESTGKINKVKHLGHVKIKCIETGKAIFCRIFGPGASQSNEYYRIFRENIRTSICLDAYFQQKLDIPVKDVYGPRQEKGNGDYTFVITPVGFIGKIIAALTHPEDGIRIGMTIAMISLGVGLFSLLVSIISLAIAGIFSGC